MLGLNDKSWLVEKFYETKHGPIPMRSSIVDRNPPLTYDTYFGLGHSIRLIDEPEVFKVSLAGLAFGSCMLRELRNKDFKGTCLDLGTGSGVLALLLRSMGAEKIVGTDISAPSIALAIRNEKLNFTDNRINFSISDLFSNVLEAKKFSLIIFNPPGWRTPSKDFLEELSAMCGENNINPSAMFYGDDILLKFLIQLPKFLKEDGRAIIGLNSLVGIKDVLTRYRNEQNFRCPLQLRLLERHTLPLMFYSDLWESIGPRLLEEFSFWQKHHQSAYSLDSKGNLYWSYELVECRWNNEN